MRFQLILACELPPPNIAPSPAAHNAEWHDFIHAIPGGDWFLLALSMIPAIYTGLVASRAFAFYQARYRAVNWAYAMDGIIHRRDLSPNQFFISLSHSIMPLMLEFRALGHEAFVTALADCAKRYFS